MVLAIFVIFESLYNNPSDDDDDDDDDDVPYGTLTSH